MKYLPLRELEDVTSALNFDTSDCHVAGGCDLYTTKAAGSDKKLYKNIEATLEEQGKDLIRISSASLSPPEADSLTIRLKRSSPFGSLNDVSSRRTFMYLIATLNASHPDYDFSQVLKPDDFRKERSLRTVMSTLDETIHNLKPRANSTFLTAPLTYNSKLAGPQPQTPGGTQSWGPRMWWVIDKEMDLKKCQVYCYSPDEDPFDGEENALWSINYMFYNKDRKRVCYIYLRGLSVSSHSPSTLSHANKRPRSVAVSESTDSKRARYWTGVADDDYARSGSYEDGDDAYGTIDDAELDEFLTESSDWSSPDHSSDFENDIGNPFRGRKNVRAMSEHIMETMEV